MRRRTIVFIISTVLAIGLAVNYWLPFLTTDSVSVVRPSTADYYFKQVSIKQFDSQGNLSNQIKAEKLEHFKSLELSQLIAPQILVQDPEQINTQWSVIAQKGQLEHAHKLITFEGDVEIQQSAVSTKAKAVINTEALIFDLNQNTALSDSAVEITTSNSKTTANNMTVDFNNEQVNLSGKVQTEGFINEAEKQQ